MRDVPGSPCHGALSASPVSVQLWKFLLSRSGSRAVFFQSLLPQPWALSFCNSQTVPGPSCFSGWGLCFCPNFCSWTLQSQDPQCRVAFHPWGAGDSWADSRDPCIQNENMVFTFYNFSAVPVWNVICSSTFLAGEEVTDLKRQAVEEMMDRIKKGVHLRPVNQSSRPKTKVWNK